MKCYPDPVILEALVALGAGFDCASKGTQHFRTSYWYPLNQAINKLPISYCTQLKSKRRWIAVQMLTQSFMRILRSNYRSCDMPLKRMFAKLLWTENSNCIRCKYISLKPSKFSVTMTGLSWIAKSHWPFRHLSSGFRIRLVLRISCDAKFSVRKFADKYGCDPVLEAPRLIRLAKTLGLNVRFRSMELSAIWSSIH